MLVFTDRVLGEISTGIAAHDPERGGALFGIRDSNVICHLACDAGANRSRVHYLPSVSLQQQVLAIERQTNLVFKGIIHSHPGQLSTPSGQDLIAFSKSLADNPHLPSFIAPIVTLGADRPLEPHELNLSIGQRMSIYVAHRGVQKTWFRSTDTPRVEPCAATVMPIEGHMSLLCSTMGFTSEGAQIERGYFCIGHVSYISMSARFDAVEVIALFPPIYPFAQPLVMISSAGRDPFFVELPFGAEFNLSLDEPSWIQKLADIVRSTEGYDGKRSN